MRKINTEDVFKMARLLKNSDVIKTVKNAYEAGKKENADSEKIGLDAAMEILISCTDPKIEAQFYDLVSGICEKKPEDIRTQSLEGTIEDIKKICQENNIGNFLKSASGLSGKILS